MGQLQLPLFCLLLSVVHSRLFPFLYMSHARFPRIFFSVILLLAACAPRRQLPTPPSPLPSDMSVVEPEDPAAAMPLPGDDAVDEMLVSGVYMPYEEGFIGDGEPAVLFFHAVWCPTCKRVDEMLTQWYEEEDFPLSVYQVDYDSAQELKARYGVTSQHTFVLVDGEGNALQMLTAPSDSDLRALLQTKI